MSIFYRVVRIYFNDDSVSSCRSAVLLFSCFNLDSNEEADSLQLDFDCICLT